MPNSGHPSTPQLQTPGSRCRSSRSTGGEEDRLSHCSDKILQNKIRRQMKTETESVTTPCLQILRLLQYASCTYCCWGWEQRDRSTPSSSLVCCLLVACCTLVTVLKTRLRQTSTARWRGLASCIDPSISSFLFLFPDVCLFHIFHTFHSQVESDSDIMYRVTMHLLYYDIHGILTL